MMLTKFYFIDIQSLCEISERPEARYQPCEIALVEYSLHSGITRSYQRFIDPGENVVYIGSLDPHTTHAHTHTQVDVDSGESVVL